MKRKNPNHLTRKGVRDSRTRLTPAKVKAALIANYGVQARAADALGVKRPRVCEMVKRHPELRKVIDDMIPEVVDMARDHIVTHMDSSDASISLRASSKVLDTYGGALGLGVKQHRLAGPDGGPLQFDLSGLSDEELEALRSIRSKLAAATVGDRGGDRSA